MKSCAFFGHRKYFDYESEIGEKLKNLLEELISEDGIIEFYNGYRGNFDRLCAQKVALCKRKFPNIQNILVLSYLNSKKELPEDFDNSIYLLEGNVPPRYAIDRTNKLLVEKVDIVISGVKFCYGGAWNACDYARRRNKTIYNVFEL